MAEVKGQRSVLFVEDCDEDYESTRRALTRAGLTGKIHRCVDGEEALSFLQSDEGGSGHSPSDLPSLILLDLNLPGMRGQEVLKSIKSTEKLRHIPVVIFSTSGDPEEVEGCYTHGANSYVQKPSDVRVLYDRMEQIKEYWFDIVELPKHGRAGAV